MALFGSLSERLNHIFSKLTKRGKLTELEIKTAMREVRVALLEADVNIGVVKSFVARVSERAVGQEILKSLSPTQQVIKIVNEELIELMGSSNSKLAVSSTPPMLSHASRTASIVDCIFSPAATSSTGNSIISSFCASLSGHIFASSMPPKRLICVPIYMKNYSK